MPQTISTRALKQAPRVLFFGMLGNFSPLSLTALLASGVDVCAVVLPATLLPGTRPPAIQRRPHTGKTRRIVPLVREGMRAADLLQMATERQLPIWEVSRLAHREAVETLASYHPDLICVACFPQLIPRVIRELPKHGCLNVHPSLLPANRGPVPLFWDLREGCMTTGVTIHEVDAKMDSGVILAQETLAIPDGISYEQLEMSCAESGGKLLARTVWAVYEGQATRRLQDEARSSYHSFPTAKDFVVDPSAWSARYLYNFIRGVRNWESSIVLQDAGEQIRVRDAIAFGEEEVPPSFADEQMPNWGTVRLVQCRSGWVRIWCDDQGESAS